MSEITKEDAKMAREYIEEIIMSGHPAFVTTFIKVAEPFARHKWMIEAMAKCEQNNPWHIYNVLDHTRQTIYSSTKDLIVRLTMLLHDTGKPIRKTTDSNGVDHFYGHNMASVDIANEFLNYYQYPEEMIKQILTLIQYHDYRFSQAKNKAIEKLYNKIGFEMCMKLIDVRRADIRGQVKSKIQDRLLLAELAANRFTLLHRGKKLEKIHENAEIYYGQQL